MSKHAVVLGKDVNTLSPALLQHLERSPWHGNVRELEGYVTRLVLMAQGQVLELPDLSGTDSIAVVDGSMVGADEGGTALEDAERRHILKVLDRTRWVITGKTGAANALSLPPSTLRSKMARLGIRRPKGET